MQAMLCPAPTGFGAPPLKAKVVPMDVVITLKNYRCFADSRPATFQLGEGFTSFIGINNVGKSAALRFFWEFRGLLSTLSDPNQSRAMLSGQLQGFPMDQELLGRGDVFSNGNNRDL